VPGQEDISNAWMKGDEKAFEQLFRSYYQPLCNRANAILNDIDEAEETVQNIFIILWEKREQMEINFSIKSYLYRAVHNAALNRIKHNKVRVMYVKEHEQAVPSTGHTTQQAFGNELQEQIQAAIESLPEQCRLVFKLSRFEELKYREIAGQLGISVKTVENQMGKALKILREKLRDYLVLIVLFLNAQMIS
jgi:RNA polymerase sigma-70 factor (family 1)